RLRLRRNAGRVLPQRPHLFHAGAARAHSPGHRSRSLPGRLLVPRRERAPAAFALRVVRGLRSRRADLSPSRAGMSTAPSASASLAASPAVLVVDDVEANLLAIRALLEPMDCDVVLASSGNEALRQLLKRKFAVMLLDVQMPEMDGNEVARYARQNPATRDVPIIFLTAANHNEERVLRAYGS